MFLNKIWIFLLGILLSINTKAQFTFQKNIIKTGVCIPGLDNTINENSDPHQAPKPGGIIQKNKDYINAERKKKAALLHKSSVYQNQGSINELPLDSGFISAQIASGTPLDNHVSVSKNGKIVSVINSSIAFYDQNGKNFKSMPLFVFGRNKGIPDYINDCYDPKTLYDPINDRFIVVYLNGRRSERTATIMAFSKTNDPNGEWNFYKIPGNPLQNKKWSDYPIICQNHSDIFLTLNLLEDSMDWKDGFHQSVIWQISKKDGFNGDTLSKVLYYNLKFNNKPIWSICPVQGSPQLTSNEMYFLSVRPADISNDTVFLHHIYGNAEENNSKYHFNILKTNTKYGMPPTAIQPNDTNGLATNDARVLSATIKDNWIQYCQTSVSPVLTSGIFHGIIDLNYLKSTIKSNIIYRDTMDMAYPSITMIGKGKDLKSIITFSCVTKRTYPGTALVLHSNVSNIESAYSDIKIIKKGENKINVLLSGEERWGDYTQIQIDYNNPNQAWVCGSYGKINKQNGTWLGKIQVNSNNVISLIEDIIINPNPSNSIIYISLNTLPSGTYDIEIVSNTGQSVYRKTFINTVNQAQFDTLDIKFLSPGLYHILIKEQNKVITKSKFVKH